MKNSLNVFVIPSWYPNPQRPADGIFFREQAQALADLHPEFNVIVSRWGQNTDEILLYLKNPSRVFKSLYWWLKNSKTTIGKKENIFEFFSAALPWSPKLPWFYIKPIILANRKNFLSAKKKFGKIDLIHAHACFPGGYIASKLSQAFEVPFILTEHMSPFPFPEFLNSEGKPIPEIAETFSKVSETIAVSPSLAETIISFGFKPPKVIPNLVDERCFFPSPPKNDARFHFLTVANASPQKGLDILLHAIALGFKDNSKVCFNIAGRGNLDSFFQLSNRLKISHLINWMGPLDRLALAQSFLDCHAFVLPSRHETFGVVYAEALACGKPVIGTRCGGPESIINDKNGFLVNVEDVAALENALQKMIERWECFDPLVIRKDFESRFSRHIVIKKIVDVYRQVV